jgi:hypothetical protein
MGLDVSAENLYREIEAAETLRNKHIHCADQLVRAYVGYNYRKDWTSGDPQPENHGFELISLMLGRLVADNPAFSITTHHNKYQALAFAATDALNEWTKQEHLQDVLEAIVLDSFFCFGVGITSLEDDPRAVRHPLAGVRQKPTFRHLPYWRYFTDPTSCHGIPPRYQGHVWYRDKDDLLKDSRFNKKAIEDLIADVDLNKINPNADSRLTPDRNQIVGYEIWVPDAPTPGDDPDEHGMIFTLGVVPVKEGKDHKQAFIRDPRPYYGPREGPYHIFGGWPVPGGAYPLAPLAATKEQADELNAHVVAAARSATQMKDLILVSANNSGLADTIKAGKHGHVYKVKGFTPGMFEKVSIGGPSNEMLRYIEIARDRLDRTSGISEAQRGNPDPRVTATAEANAAQSSSIRVETQVNFVKRAVVKVAKAIAWYQFHCEDCVSLLSSEASEQLGTEQAAYVGGPHPSTEGMDFEGFAFDIQPYSMERVDPIVQQGRVQQMVSIVVGMAQQMPSMPWVDWDEIINQVARAHNAPWVNKIIKDDILQQVMQQMQQPPQPEIKAPPLAYVDAPPDVKAQIEQMYGLQPSQLWGMVPPYDPNQPKKSGNPATIGAAFLPSTPPAPAGPEAGGPAIGPEEMADPLVQHMLGEGRAA